MKPISISLSGTTPLLCGRPASEVLPEGQPPRAQAALRLYLDTGGHPVIPSLNLLRAITGAARERGRSSAEIIHHLGIQEREIRIVSQRSWVVDSRSIRIPNTGERGICHRPRFDDWRLTCTLLHDPSGLSVDELHALVDLAGQRIGVGDYRPERGGPFGRFAVTLWGGS